MWILMSSQLWQSRPSGARALFILQFSLLMPTASNVMCISADTKGYTIFMAAWCARHSIEVSFGAVRAKSVAQICHISAGVYCSPLPVSCLMVRSRPAGHFLYHCWHLARVECLFLRSGPSGQGTRTMWSCAASDEQRMASAGRLCHGCTIMV